MRVAKRPGAGSTTGRKTHINPFEGGKGQGLGSETSRPCRKFTSVHASIHNHFNHQRHLNRRDIFKQGRAAALAEWRPLAV